MRNMPTPSFSVESDQKQVLLEKISEIIDRFKIKSMLDIGAGHPVLAVPLSKKVDTYVGVEARPDRVRRLQSAGLEIVEGKFPKVEIANTFDLVLSSHSIPEKVYEYSQFLERAWELVHTGGRLVIVTFKGAGGDLENLANLLREDRKDRDRQKYDEMMRVLSTFGKVLKEKVTSHSNSEDVEQMADLLSFSIGGSDDEKSLYRQKLKDILNEKYEVEGKFKFPHKHLVLIVRKPDSAQKKT